MTSDVRCAGESPGGDSGLEVKDAVSGAIYPELVAAAVWCVTSQHDLIAAGCGNGTIEVRGTMRRVHVHVHCTICVSLVSRAHT